MSAMKSRNVKRLFAAAALLAVPMTIAVGYQPTAFAATVSVGSGTAGAIELEGPMILATDTEVLTGSGSYEDSIELTAQGVSVGYSGVAAGPQQISVRYTGQAFIDGEWRWFAWSDAMTREVAGATQTATFGSWSTTRPWAGEDYRIVYDVTWKNATGTVATARIEPSWIGDVFCATSKMSCEMLEDRIHA